jgi:hypothetical protein
MSRAYSQLLQLLSSDHALIWQFDWIEYLFVIKLKVELPNTIVKRKNHDQYGTRCGVLYVKIISLFHIFN